MRIKNLIFVTLIKVLIFSSVSLANEKLWLCGNEIMQHIIMQFKLPPTVGIHIIRNYCRNAVE